MTNFQEMDSNVPSFIGITMAFHFYCIIKYQWHCVPDSKLAKTMNISEFMLKFRMDKPGSLYIPHVPWQFSESTLKWVEDLFLFFGNLSLVAWKNPSAFQRPSCVKQHLLETCFPFQVKWWVAEDAHFLYGKMRCHFLVAPFLDFGVFLVVFFLCKWKGKESERGKYFCFTVVRKPVFGFCALPCWPSWCFW